MLPEQRKSRSETLLSAMGIGINPHLPVIESEAEVSVRSPREVAERCLLLFAACLVADGVPKDRMKNCLIRAAIFQAATPFELGLLESGHPSDNDIQSAFWASEGMAFLLWSMNKLDLQLPPVSRSQPESLMKVLPKDDEDWPGFLASASLRPKEQILDASDLLYRAHWACRQYQLDTSTQTGLLKPGCVFEYHRAVNWLTCYDGGADWDDVGTDT